jgi:hypothetical protein
MEEAPPPGAGIAAPPGDEDALDHVDETEEPRRMHSRAGEHSR